MDENWTNVGAIRDRSLCVGCGTCQALCPKGAVRIVLDPTKGIYQPEIDGSVCIQCRECIRICPGYSVNFDSLSLSTFGKISDNDLLGYVDQAYTAFASDKALRYEGSSGGIATAILLYALKNNVVDGALVTGFKADTPWESRPFIARSPSEIITAATSKYCPVSINVALCEVLSIEGRYAFVGLPCHVHAIRKAQARNKLLKDRIKLVIGLFCASSRTYKGLDALLDKLGVKRDDISDIKYRGSGWPGKMSLLLKSEKKLKIDLDDYYPFMCCNNPYRCSLCPDKTSEFADISLGDAWDKEIENKDKIGTSVCIIRSETGKDLFARFLDDEAAVAVPIDGETLIRVAKPFDKKRGVKARIKISEIMGRSVPEIKCRLQPCNVSDYIYGLKYYILQYIGKYDTARRVYFHLRPKYQSLRPEIF